jgi:metacaspase-1
MGSGNSKPSTASATASDFTKPDSPGFASATNVINYVPAAPTGRRLALCMGNNYTGSNIELGGCINDATKMNTIFNNWGFTCTLMTDLKSGDLKVTKENILNKLNTLLSSLDTNDTLFIYYSGHGAVVTDTSGDEVYGKDSVIVPVDYKTVGVISDDIIRTYLLKATKGNVFTMFDSCNSGSVCDLRYALLTTIYRTILSTKRFYDPKEWKKSIDIVTNAKYEDTNTHIVSLSGSSDTQFSYEVKDSYGNWGGALTFAFLSTLNSLGPNGKIVDIVTQTRALLSSWGRDQTPSLMSGKPFSDENITFSDYIGI